MSTFAIITLVLNVIFVLALIMGVLFGIKRGFNKSISRFITIICILIISMFIALPISNALLNTDISNILYLQVDGTQCPTLQSYFNALLSSNDTIAQAMQQSPALADFVQQAPSKVFNVFVFVLVFLLLALLSWPIWAVIVHNADKRRIQNSTKITNPNGKKVAGGAIGLLQGGLIVLALLLPIVGTMSLIKEIDKTPTYVSAYEENEQTNQNISLLDVLLEQTGEEERNVINNIIVAYDGSLVAKFNNTFSVSNIIFDTMTTTTVTEKNGEIRAIIPRNELATINKAYQAYQDLSRIDVNNLSYEINFCEIEQAVGVLFNSQMLGVFTDELATYFVAQYLEQNKNNIDEVVYEYLKKYLETYGTPQFNELKTDIMSVIQVAKILVKYDIVKTVQTSLEISPKQMCALLLGDSTSSISPMGQITNELFNSPTCQNLLIESINIGLEYLEKELSKAFDKTINIEKVEIKNVDWEIEKQNFNRIFNSLLSIFVELDNCTTNNQINTELLIQNFNLNLCGDTMQYVTQAQLLHDAYINTLRALDTVEQINKYINCNLLCQTLDWQAECSHLENVKNYLNQSGVFALLLNNEIDEALICDALEMLNKTPKHSQQKYVELIANELVSSKILQAIIPRTTNTLVSYLNNKYTLNIEYIDENSVDWEKEKQKFINICNAIVANADAIQAYTNQKSALEIVKCIDTQSLNALLNSVHESQLFYNIAYGIFEKAKENATVKKYVKLDYIDKSYNWKNEIDIFVETFRKLIQTNFFDEINKDTHIDTFLNYISNNTETTTEIINLIFDSNIAQNNIQKYVNLVEEKIQEITSTEIKRTDITQQEVQANIEQIKYEFNELIINLVKILPSVFKEDKKIDINTLCKDDNLIIIGNIFSIIKNSKLFNNIYVGFVDFLKNNETIKSTIDFSVIDDKDFDWKKEMQTLNSLVKILKNNKDASEVTLWDRFLENPSNLNNLIENMSTDAKHNAMVLVAQSKFFSNSIRNVLNEMLNVASEMLETTLSPIPLETDISKQTDNILVVADNLLVLKKFDGNIQNLDLESFSNLMTALNESKFEITNGVFAELYDELVKWLTNETKNPKFAKDISKAIQSFDENQPILYEIDCVDWSNIALLLSVNTFIETISTLTNTQLSPVSYTTNINSEQKENLYEIIKLGKSLVDFEQQTFDLNKIELIKFGDMLNLIKQNKFSNNYVGILEQTYNAITIWLSNYEKVGFIIEKEIQDYSTQKSVEIQEIAKVDWKNIFIVLPYNVAINEIANLTSKDIELINGTTILSNSEILELNSIIVEFNELFPNTEIDFDNVGLSKFATGLNHLKIHKFNNNGKFSGCYDAIVQWIEENEYGYIIKQLAQTYNQTSQEIPTENIANVDWKEIFTGIEMLQTLQKEIDEISTLSTDKMLEVIKKINIFSVENQNIEDIIKIYLTHNMSEQIKIDAIMNFDFKDYNTLEIIISNYNSLNNAILQLQSDKNTALAQILQALKNLEKVDQQKINNTISFVDTICNQHYCDTLNNIDFKKDSDLVNVILGQINQPNYSLEHLNSLLNSLIDSQFVLNILYENNIVLINTQDEQILQSIKENLAKKLGVSEQQISDEQTKSYLQTMVSNLSTSQDIKDKISKLLNLN